MRREKVYEEDGECACAVPDGECRGEPARRGTKQFAPVKGMASTVGLYVYPKNSQSATQQLTDESQCYTNAKTQTGYDPNTTTTAAAPKKQDPKSGDDHDMAKGAARGAIISGATGGDAAAGARRGAIIGGIKEKRK